VNPVETELTERPAKTGHPEKKENPANPVYPAKTEHPERKAIKAIPARIPLYPVHKGLPARTARTVFKGQKAHADLRATPAKTAQLLVQRGHRAKMVNPE
jgi:hypothetical protein